MTRRRIRMHISRPVLGVAAALAALTPLHLAYVWAHPYFISQDGGAHAYTSWILMNYADPDYPFLREYFTLDLRPYPNWTGYWILIPLMKLFSSATAEKCLVSIYVVLFPIALLYAIASVRRRSAWLALPGATLTLNWYLHMGFYNYLFGATFLLFAAGFFIRHRRRPSTGRVAVLGVILLLVYFSHLLAIAACFVAGACIVAEDLLRRGPRLRRAAQLLPWLAAVAPAAILTLWFLNQPPPSGRVGGRFFIWERFFPRLQSFLTLHPGMYTFRVTEKYPQVAMELMFGLIAAAGIAVLFRRRAKRGWGLFAAGLIFFFIAVAGPEEYGGGGYVAVRLSFFGYLFILAGAAMVRWPPLVRRIGGATAFLLAVGVMTFRMDILDVVTSHYSEFETSFARTRRGDAVLPVILTRRPWRPPDEMMTDGRTAPLLHLSGHVGVRLEFIDLSHYQANADFFPVRWRAPLSPVIIGSIGQPYPRIAADRYEAAAPGRLAGIVVWDNGGPETAFAPPRRYLMQHMPAPFVLTLQSYPNGYGENYRRAE